MFKSVLNQISKHVKLKKNFLKRLIDADAEDEFRIAMYRFRDYSSQARQKLTIEKKMFCSFIVYSSMIFLLLVIMHQFSWHYFRICKNFTRIPFYNVFVGMQLLTIRKRFNHTYVDTKNRARNLKNKKINKIIKSL